MPIVKANGIRQYYRIEGRGDRPALVLSHSLGCDHTLWEEVVSTLAPHFRVLRYDTRGHGATEVTPGDYSIELLAKDVLALVDALGIERFALCGLSLGGMIGQRIGARAANRLTALVLANTSSQYPDPSLMETRRRTALERGIAAVEETAMSRFFVPEMLRSNPPAVTRVRHVLQSTDPMGYAGCCAAIRDMQQTALLGEITAPSLLIVGDHDVSTPWSPHGETIAAHIHGVRVQHLPTAHLSPVERPRSFAAAVLQFLIPAEADTLAAGFQRRREVLGDAHVDRAMANSTPFNAAFQELITRYAWGNVWSRTALDDRTRRLLVLAITAALGRQEEFRLHVRAGLIHGLEPCDIEEALLQTAIYAGVPAANTAFRIASEEMAKQGEGA
jgi:3-oxoadipate enol-lactonase / 4-carboxymuconolactone decarboxylase